MKAILLAGQAANKHMKMAISCPNLSPAQFNYLELTRRHQMDTGQRRPEWAPCRELGRVPEREGSRTHCSQCLQTQEGREGRRWGFAAGQGLT